MGITLLSDGEWPDNSDRAEWAEHALKVFCDHTGLDLGVENHDAVSDLICNLGHYCDLQGLNFLNLIECAVSVWDAEKREEANGEVNALYPQKKVLISLFENQN